MSTSIVKQTAKTAKTDKSSKTSKTGKSSKKKSSNKSNKDNEIINEVVVDIEHEDIIDEVEQTINKKKNKSKKIKSKSNEDTEENEQNETVESIKKYTGQIISTNKYKFKNWIDTFPNCKVDIMKFLTNKDWLPFFEKPKVAKIITKINKQLSGLLEKTKGKINIYPYPQLLFHVFNILSPKHIKCVIMGQDPYINQITEKDKIIPQAMGISFSVPTGVHVPDSLVNIYKNMKQYGHIKLTPEHGNLTSWVNQGVFLLNASLTVEAKFSNSHKVIWSDFSDLCIKYISKHCEHVIFVAWGKDAHEKITKTDDNINAEKHQLTVSSHPSPLAYAKEFRNFGAFKDVDHFKIINNFLKKHDLDKIIWQI